MNYLSKIKEHWLISAIILCGAVFITIWTLSGYLVVEPRNFESENLPSESASIVKTENMPDYEKKSLPEGTSFTSKFGFVVYISDADNVLKHAGIYITLETQKNKNYKNVSIGRIIKLTHDNHNYSIEINDIRDNLVDLTIHKNT